MERIVYRKTLDVHKNGIQFTLQGFETDDKMSRRVEISLMASGDTIDLPLEQIAALMYVTTPNAAEPSINECTIKDNTIIYDVLPILEEGITEMQIKLIDTRPEGAKGILPSPKFAVEVSKSNTDDDSAMQTTTFTALENAIATAKSVYDSRMLRVEIDTDCMFRVIYADGTVYETDVLNETLLKGEAILSQSYARGGTGTRTSEDTDNSMYYSNVSKSVSEDAQRVNKETIELLGETRKHSVYTAFSIDFDKGEVMYISPVYKFNINKENGNLEAIGQAYTPEETVNLVVNEWLNQKGADIIDLKDRMIWVEEQIHGSLEPLGNAVGNLWNEVNIIKESVDGLETELGTKTQSLEKTIDSLGTDLFDRIEAMDKKVTKLENTTISMGERLTDVETDYILETGKYSARIYEENSANGTILWTYRKWNSGIVECWGTTKVATMLNFGWSGGFTRENAIGVGGAMKFGFDLPDGLFTEIETHHIDIGVWGHIVFATNIECVLSGTTPDIKTHLWSTTEMTDEQEITIHISAKGRWK